jgi:hypothetical protein
MRRMSLPIMWPPFDAHKDGDFFLGMGAANVVGGSGEEQVLGMVADGGANGVNLVESFLHRGRALDAGVDEDGEEQRVEAAFAHAGNVDVAAAGVALGEVVVLGEEELRGVGVSVEHDGGEVELVSVVGGGVRGRERGDCKEKGQGAEKSEAAAHGDSSEDVMSGESLPENVARSWEFLRG